MTLVRCTACDRRYATPLRRCRRCGGDEFVSTVLFDVATVGAVTSVPEAAAGSPRFLIVAELSDVAVLAHAEQPLEIGMLIRVTDAVGGGFAAAAAS